MTQAQTQKVSHAALVARLASAQKSSRGAAGYSRWVNRRLGRHLAAVAFRLGLTPNLVSILSGLVTAVGIVGVATLRPGPVASTAVVLVLLLGYAMDSADGQLARLRGGGSWAGEWLDHVLDAAKIVTFHLAIAISFYRFEAAKTGQLLLALGFCAASSVFFFALILADMLRRISAAQSGASPADNPNLNSSAAAPVLRSLIVLPNDYGVLCLALLLMPAHTAFVVVYALLLAANVLFLVTGAVRWFREMRVLPTA